MSCMFKHDAIDKLYHVLPTPISRLPKRCGCGATITYAPVVLFYSHQTHDFIEVAGYEGDRQLTALELRPYVMPLILDQAAPPLGPLFLRLAVDTRIDLSTLESPKDKEP